MKKIVVALNVIIALYFFVLANLYFWGSILVLLVDSFGSQSLFENTWRFTNTTLKIFFAPFLIYGAIIFFRKTKKKYIYGLILLFIIWLETQIYSFMFVTNQKLELNDLSDFLFYAVPFLIIYLTRNINKKTENRINS